MADEVPQNKPLSEISQGAKNMTPKSGTEVETKPSTPEEKATAKEEPSDLKPTVQTVTVPEKKGLFQKIRNIGKKQPDETASTSKVDTLAQEAVTEQVYRKIVEMKGNEYWVFRIRKRTVLIATGLVLAGLWMVPLGKWLVRNYLGNVTYVNGNIVIEHTATIKEAPAGTITEAPDGPLIRIRNTLDTEEEAQRLQSLLKENSLLNVEIAQDQESTISGVGIVVKAGDDAIRDRIESVLIDHYRLVIPSAELTADSDFDAVIFLGTEAVRVD